MQVRFANARLIAWLIILVGVLAIVAGVIFNGNPQGVFNFQPQQVLILGIIWALVGILLLLFIRSSDEPAVDPNSVTRIEGQIKTFETRFKDVDARLDARVGDVDTRFGKRIGDVDTRYSDLDTRLKALETAPRALNVKYADDDLELIEGIGPKIATALKAGGIGTFSQLARAGQSEIRAALDKSGIDFAPSIDTWAVQAQYLAEGDVQAFEAYKAKLTAGRD